ncbi:ABC transporter [Candidatus Syntrophocurvum alkaliphilum]|uniref:ABC transporter n=1 Tax=Candidatus Syntrophocurvum alkaliphilum TaxID=2293317 RepID=A0A6I6DB00_9FIRM|nr:ABC transporter substrate-binding protein [Candidatus Syntrophocurvum alkaliphilum]QGT98645.1 ABC transporter [Candidatus Syntrophocurvum alkaliphilum]
MKKRGFIYFSVILMISAMFMLGGCGTSETGKTGEELPLIQVGYVHVDHQSPLFVAAKKGEDISENGPFLQTVIDKEEYKLISDGEAIADVELIATKSGSEAATLFAQNHIDMALFSITAAMTGIDNGTPFKILGPIHTEGLGLVFPQGSGVKGWGEFLAYVEEQDEPVKIGYHSPTSAPKIVFEGALHREGIDFTADINDLTADILMVDLRATSNFIPAMNSNQVDAWVGPSPHPQVATTTGVGELVLDLRDLPPEGYWHDFPCCIVAATEALLTDDVKVAEQFMQVMTDASSYCNENRDILAEVTADWIGIPQDAAQKSTVVYTTDPSENWVRGAGIYLDVLNDMGNFTGALQDKELEEVDEFLFNFDIVEKTLQ